MEANNLELIVKLTLARLDIIKLKHANAGYDWSMCGKEGQKLLEDTLAEIDNQLHILNLPK